MQNLLNNIKLYYVNAAIANANNTNDASDILDLSGWEGVIFLVPITDCAQTGVATLTVQQNTINSASGMAALAGAVATATSAANDDLNGKLLVVDLYRPTERYIRSVLTSATANIAFGDTIAILYQGSKMPVAQLAAEVADSAVVVSPAES